tara:strand:- start:463 stop:1344 length:882 start_codon:yes stop_codon:yes gene_type:complete
MMTLQKSMVVLTAIVAFSCLTFSAGAVAQEEYTFHHQIPQVGQQWVQSVQMKIKAKSRIKYPGHQQREVFQLDQRRQNRRLTVLGVQPQSVPRVEVTFESALHHTSEDWDAEPRWEFQAVHGKTYRVWRENGQLVVTNPQGTVPSSEEVEIVRQSMQSVGRGNPIAQFLHQRTVEVGQTLHLPAELARELLGTDTPLNKDQKMPMTLLVVREIRGVLCGIFEADLENTSQLGARTSTHMHGKFAVELDTCRVVSTVFQGPVTYRLSRSIGGESYVVETAGSLQVEMKAETVRR